MSLEGLCSGLRCGSVAEVEDLVMKACHYGVLSARIDQTQNSLRVHTVLKQKFGKEEWASLSKRLEGWIQKIGEFEAELAGA